MYRQWFIILAFLAAAATARGELPEGATVLDQDIVWDIGDPDCATISPGLLRGESKRKRSSAS